jgi:transposase
MTQTNEEPTNQERAGKHAGGRPTLYKPEYCDLAKEFMGQGFSLTAFAGEIDVSRETVYAWERGIPEFSDAIKVARAKRVGFLEVDLLNAESGPKVTSRIFALKNACADEWSDKVVQQHQGPNGGPVEYRNLDKLTDDDLRVLQAIQMKLGDGGS